MWYANCFNLDQSNTLLPGNGLTDVVNIKALPKDKFLDWSKLKAFVDKIKFNEKLELVLGRVGNIVVKGENAGYQHFLLFPQWFQKPSL